jgi:hypothetical protein
LHVDVRKAQTIEYARPTNLYFFFLGTLLPFLRALESAMAIQLLANPAIASSRVAVIDDQRVREDARPLAPGPSCVSPAPQFKREWSLWPQFGRIRANLCDLSKEYFCADISEFESHMASHAVCLDHPI